MCFSPNPSFKVTPMLFELYDYSCKNLTWHDNSNEDSDIEEDEGEYAENDDRE